MLQPGTSRRWPKPAGRAAFGAALLALVGAQTALAAGPQPAPPVADDKADERQARRAELDAITRQITLTEERQAALAREISAIDTDSAGLTRTLIEVGERAQGLEGRLDDTEKRLGDLAGKEADLRASLKARRGVLVEVLAALQRMGRKPPPAILVRPEDALASVRSAILLGGVVPDLRIQAEALVLDLKELVDIRTAINSEHDSLKRDSLALAEDRKRIELLIEQKKKARVASTDALADERRKAADLARQAGDLKDLIEKMERESVAAASAADKARRADEARLGKPPLRGSLPGATPGPLGGSDRIAPAIAFADAKKLLPRPVNGVDLKHFGDDDGLGGRTQGLSIGTRSAARVSSPADGWVVYAGPFRSFGQLLIINGGGGYHVLLAGMERIDVEIGQFVLAGEPVAVMGDHRLASAGTVDMAVTQPVLYVEFRKEGSAIDPAPWWARSNDEKVGG